jgi:hypothetical protein
MLSTRDLTWELRRTNITPRNRGQRHKSADQLLLLFVVAIIFILPVPGEAESMYLLKDSWW